MKKHLPIIGITMGDPVGIGPEIILQSLYDPQIYDLCRPLVIGDRSILASARKCLKRAPEVKVIQHPGAGSYRHGCADLLSLSHLDPDTASWGHPTAATGAAMISYITAGADMATRGEIAAMVTGPINKMAMKLAGSEFSGHTELLAHLTHTENFAMMMAGDRLRVVLVTIHIPLENVPKALSPDTILTTIELTNDALTRRFGIKHPRIAVAALNPHAGEEGLFGNDESHTIAPAMVLARKKGIDLSGPFPPDTLFYQAANGQFDAVICMYHDQGLIPFKMLHFSDGVNVTLGLPIIRTSVDHGTAYDIAGTGAADPGSLTAAIKMAALHAGRRMRNDAEPIEPGNRRKGEREINGY